MSTAYPVGSQASALRHIHAIARRTGDANEQTLQAAAQGIRTIDWIAARPELCRALAVLFDTFPTAELAEVRELDGQPD